VIDESPVAAAAQTSRPSLGLAPTVNSVWSLCVRNRSPLPLRKRACACGSWPPGRYNGSTASTPALIRCTGQERRCGAGTAVPKRPVAGKLN